MNDLLELKGELQSSQFNGSFNISWPKYKTITCEKIDSYISDLKRLNNYWKDKDIISGALISVYYNRVIPKSSRMQGLFSKGSEPSNNYDYSHVLTPYFYIMSLLLSHYSHHLS